MCRSFAERNNFSEGSSEPKKDAQVIQVRGQQPHEFFNSNYLFYRHLPVNMCLEHQRRIDLDHSYTRETSTSSDQRNVPGWLRRFARMEVNEGMARMLGKIIRNGVNDYARAVLTDGLLLLEYRDAIHEGDGNRVETCHKFLMPYFFATKHNKYALECFRYLCAVTTTCYGKVVASQVGTRVMHGKVGRNVPVDFHMEQLNKLLKRLLIGLGANCNEEIMVRISRCINQLQKSDEHT